MFDSKVSKDRVGDELNKMFQDKKGGIRALSLMTDLGILENYVTLMCTPDAEKIPDYCFLIGKFMEDDNVTVVDDSTKSVDNFESYNNYELSHDDEISQMTTELNNFDIKVVGAHPLIDYKKDIAGQKGSKET